MGRLRAKTALRQFGGLKLARLLEMPEEEAADKLRKIESKAGFKEMLASGVLRRKPFPAAFFATRKFAGLSLAARGDGLGEALSSHSQIVRLIRKAGRAAFESSFLGGEELSDAARALKTGLTREEARKVREFLNAMYVREEFAGPIPGTPVKTYSVVAGIALRGGKPVLNFFHREIWRGAYAVDEEKLARFLAEKEEAEREKNRRLVFRLGLLDRRKSTLYNVLDCLLRAQAAYLAGGDPADRQPLTQRELAAAIGSDPSVVNRLIANKAVELPWGLEAPLRVLLPSAKSLAVDVVAGLARAKPELSDEKLRTLLAGTRNMILSRRSIAQYRKDAGLANRGRGARR